MNAEMFQDELKRIKTSFAYKNMLQQNADLAEKHAQGMLAEPEDVTVLMLFHAFHAACSSELLNSPLVIGGYIRDCLAEPHTTHIRVAEAREYWGRR